MSPQATVHGNDISLDQLPCPKHISEQELAILQVRVFGAHNQVKVERELL